MIAAEKTTLSEVKTLGHSAYPEFPADIIEAGFSAQVLAFAAEICPQAKNESSLDLQARHILEAIMTGHFLQHYWERASDGHDREALDIAMRSLKHAPLSRYAIDWFNGVMEASKDRYRFRGGLEAIQDLIDGSRETRDPYIFLNIDSLDAQSRQIRELMKLDEESLRIIFAGLATSVRSRKMPRI